MAMDRVRVAVADVVHWMPRHDAMRSVCAVTVQVVIWAPPTSRALLTATVGFPVFALAAFAVFVVALVMVMMVVRTVPVWVAFSTVHFGGTFEGVRLCEELLDRVDQVAYSPGAFVAVFRGCGCGGGALVLQRVKAVSVQRHLLLKLVQEISWDPVHFAAVGWGATIVSCFPAARGVATTVPPWCAAIVHAREGATRDRMVSGRQGHWHHHALRVDGAPWGAAAVAVKRAALSGAEEVGGGSCIAMMEVVVQGRVTFSQATGMGWDGRRELELSGTATRETLHVPGWGGVTVLIEVLWGRPWILLVCKRQRRYSVGSNSSNLCQSLF